MTQATEQISKQYAAAAINKQQWGFAYNVLVEGLVGGGVVDDTAALQALVNKAISEGRRTILFPHGTNGQYKVTALTNANQVDFVGDNATFVGGYTGQISNFGGTAEIQAVIDSLKAETIRGIINVNSYGAVGDWNGTTGTDNTTAFQNAINAAVAAGIKALWLQDGAYRVSPSLTNVNLVNFVGDNASISGYSTPVGVSQLGGTIFFPNNVNTILQKDTQGTYQNIAFYDADNGLVHGPTDVRETHIFSTPVNMFRHHVVSDFDEASTLDPKWTFTAISGGTNSQVADSKTAISTGTTSGGGGKLTLTNCNIPIIAGQRIYFYMETAPNGNLDLTFGLEVDANNYIRFRRTDAGAAGNVFAENANAGTLTSTDTTQVGNSVRRLYCIEIVSPIQIKYWVGTDAGVLQLKATHTTNIPSGNHKAFIRLVNSTTANRQVLIDMVYLIAIR